MEIKLERKPQKHRAIVSRGILDTIEYEMAMGNTAEDILDIVIDIRDTAERIIKLLELKKGEQDGENTFCNHRSGDDMDRWIFDRKKQSQINTAENTDEIQSKPTATKSTEVPWWKGE